VIAEYDGNDRLLRKYIYGARVDEPVCMIEVADSNAVYYYHFDGLGSVVALSDSDGDSCQSYEYSAYGQVAAEDPNHPNPYMFTGRRFDIETGLYHYRARCYNPHIGRFMQTDPVGYDDGINWYLYCKNNPVNFVDASGKWLSPYHWQLTKVLMVACGFSDADAEHTASHCRNVDINIFRSGDSAAHYYKGEQASAEKLIRDEMAMAVRFENMGDHDNALLHLGRALHTVQDKHAHFAQGIRGPIHHIGKDADYPLAHQRQWNEAFFDTVDLINVFKRLTSGGPDAEDEAQQYFDDYADYIQDLEDAEEDLRELEEDLREMIEEAVDNPLVGP